VPCAGLRVKPAKRYTFTYYFYREREVVRAQVRAFMRGRGYPPQDPPLLPRRYSSHVWGGFRGCFVSPLLAAAATLAVGLPGADWLRPHTGRAAAAHLRLARRARASMALTLARRRRACRARCSATACESEIIMSECFSRCSSISIHPRDQPRLAVAWRLPEPCPRRPAPTPHHE
jgi:hypothetical protein